MHNDDPLLATPEAAAYLQVESRTLESWRFRAIGPRFLRYSNRVVRYRKSDLDEFRQRSIVEPGGASTVSR